MATESSAVVRFISLAQQAQNPVIPTPPAPITSEFGTEVLRPVKATRSSRLPLIVGAIALAGGAAAGGVYLGKSSSGGSSPPEPPTRSAAAAAPLAAAERADDSAPAAAPVPAAEAPAAPASGPQVSSPVVTVPPDVLAATGFDIRVEPGATISLDGSVLGKAPLRVRNLQPGVHVLDIEAPAGYFSRRMEVALAASEAKDLKVSLDPIEEDPAVAAASADDGRKSARSRAELRRERKEKVREERERKKEMRATRIAAARAAKANKSAARSAVVAEPLTESDSKAPAKSDKQSDADAELDAAMADIVGKPSKKRSAAAAGGASSLAASAPISGASASGQGTLMLGSKPPCDIIVDGKPTGLKTPQRAMELAAGTHSVVLVNADLGIEKKFKVRIAPGKTTKAIQDLTSKLD